MVRLPVLIPFRDFFGKRSAGVMSVDPHEIERVEDVLRSAGVQTIEILGGIGVGKSTLVEALSELENMVSVPETIPMDLLLAYLEEMKRKPQEKQALYKAAKRFQDEMYQRAISRGVPAWDPNGRTRVVERPWYSNHIFEAANVILDNLSHEDHLDYCEFSRRFVSENRVILRGKVRTGRTVAFLLWTPLETRMERIRLRGREGEDGYQYEYLELLDHLTFVRLIASWQQPWQAAVMPPIIPLDWSVYGSVKDLAYACETLSSSSETVGELRSHSPALTKKRVQFKDGQYMADIDEYFAQTEVRKRQVLREDIMQALCHYPIEAVSFKISETTTRYVDGFFERPWVSWADFVASQM